MGIFDNYGITTDEPATIIKQIALALDVKFELHDSSFWGEYFRAQIKDGGEIRIIPNFHDGDWVKEEYKEYPFLLEVNEVPFPEKLLDIFINIKNINFLYRSEIEEKKWIRRYKYENGKFTMYDERFLKNNK